MTTPVCSLPLRLRELENAAYTLATAGGFVVITDGLGGYETLGVCDLPMLRTEIVAIQALDRVLKPFIQ